MHKYNFFIEGIPGSGKSYLSNALAKELPDYTAYKEGEVSPIELAWCSYMTGNEYDEAIWHYPELKDEVIQRTVWENAILDNGKPDVNHKMAIVPYTLVRTTTWEFYTYMEKYEIYSGRRSLDDFTRIVNGRYAGFSGTGNIFECSFLQNTIEELMLYQELSEDEIINFYINLMRNIDMSAFRMIRLTSKEPSLNLRQIKAERVNDKGEEEWYHAMMKFLSESPYGKQHSYHTFDDLLSHFERRTHIEEQIIQNMPSECVLHLESKNYKIEDILNNMD